LRLEAVHSRRKRKGLPFALNLEIVIFTVLLLNIGFDYLIRNIAAAATEISASPKVTVPIASTLNKEC